jgi:1,4-dihydroxy-2-naphthoate octaprenyltransferase
VGTDHDRSVNGLLANWRYVLRTTNPPAGRIDPVSKWLVLTRAAVLPMTVTAGAIAGLLAVHQRGFDSRWYALAFVGIVLAHAANNLMNDLFDLEVGLDSDQYPRGLYAPHPVLSGMISRRGLAAASLTVNGIDLAILVVLTAARGWPIIAFAVSGFVLSAAYTAPPLRLKKRGLGEPDVLVVWGPLMVGGTYYAAVGHVPWQVFAASIPYGLLCTAVLMGKHIDKIPWDAAEGIKTMPVLLGEARARRVTQGLIAAFYVTVAVDVIVGALPWPALLSFVALPTAGKAWKALTAGRPDAPPPDYPIWPLWFAAVAFLHTRRAGALLVLGLIAAAVLNITAF